MAEVLIKNPDESLGAAMRKAGYSVAQSNNPNQIMRSRTWQQLMDELIPQEKVASVLAEQLEATSTYILNGEMREKPDNQARLKAAEIAIRLRGGFAAEKSSGNDYSFSLAGLRKMRDEGLI